MAVEGADISVRCERSMEVVRPGKRWNAGRLKERNQIDSGTIIQKICVTLEPGGDETGAETVGIVSTLVYGSNLDQWLSILYRARINKSAASPFGIRSTRPF